MQYNFIICFLLEGATYLIHFQKKLHIITRNNRTQEVTLIVTDTYIVCVLRI